MRDLPARIVGYGYAVPSQVRTNDDPVFDWLRAHPPSGSDLFSGFVERRVLAPQDSLMTLLEPAAHMAMEHAGIGPSHIDMLLGYASPSPFATPNHLCQLHQVLQLSERAFVVPINSEFSNFNSALLMAHALITSRSARTILIAVGGAWTRGVDYQTPQSIGAGDGAAAVVMQASGDSSKFRFIDQHAIVDTSYFGTMYLQGDRVECDPPCHEQRELSGTPYFHIEPRGFSGFDRFGRQRAPTAVTALMGKYALDGQDFSLVSHQASSVLLKAWASVIRPRHYIQTIRQFGNMTLANIPVNLAWAMHNEPIVSDSLMLLSLGTEMHANAQLWSRGNL